MADIIKDSFVEAIRLVKVIYQRGKDVMPWELNEMQDNLRVQAYRTAQYGVASAALNPGSNDAGWQIIGTGASNETTVEVGYLFCDGIPLSNGASFTLSGFTTYGGAGSRTDVVYLAVTETEISDPSYEPLVGETTRRRQIQITVSISETGLAGVPANTIAEIFAGGTHYFPIAEITRPTGQAAINVNEVTDLRYLLPAGLMDQITRQADHKVQAVVCTVLETPGIGGNPLAEANSITIDVDPDDAFVEAGTVAVRFNRNATPETPFIIRETVGAVPGNVGSDGTLMLRDAAIIAVAGVTQQNTIAFSTISGAGNCLRVGERSPPTVGVDAPSLLHAINARGCITVGDGSVSFGDFNGQYAIADAINYVATWSSGLGCSARIFVKRGDYAVSDINPMAIGLGHEIIIDGEAGAGGSTSQAQVTIFNYRTTAGAFDVTDGKLTLRNINLIGIGASAFAVKATNGSPIVMEHCNLTDLGLYSEGARLSGLCNGPQVAVRESIIAMLFKQLSAVVIEQGNGNVNDGYRFQRCRIIMNDDHPVLLAKATTGIAAATSVTGVLFDACEIQLGSSSVDAATWNGLANNSGVIGLDPNGSNGLLTIEDVTYRECNVFATGASGNTVLMYLRTQVAASEYIAVGTVRIDGGRWACSNDASVETLISPFYIGGETAIDTPHIAQFIAENVRWGFGPELPDTTSDPAIHGDMPAEVGAVAYPAAFYIHADAVVIRNVEWLQMTNNAGSCDLTIYRPKTLLVEGIIMRNWTATSASLAAGFSDYRIYVEGYKLAGTAVADYVGSDGCLRGVTIDGVSLGGRSPSNTAVVGVLPNGRLSIDSASIRDFTSLANGIHLLQAPTTIAFNSFGLSVTNSRFANVAGDGIFYVHDGTINVQGAQRTSITGNVFYKCIRGVVFDDSAAGAGVSTAGRITNNTFDGQSGFGVELNSPSSPWTVTGNTFSFNNGGGLTSIQAYLVALGTLMGNTCADDDNRLQLPTPSSWRGAATGYSVGGPITLASAAYTDSDSMLYNHAKLKTP